MDKGFSVEYYNVMMGFRVTCLNCGNYYYKHIIDFMSREKFLECSECGQGREQFKKKELN